MKKEKIKNVIPGFTISAVYKSTKKGLSSFRITKQLLKNTIAKAKKLKQVPYLVISIPANEKERYILTCKITKEKN